MGKVIVDTDFLNHILKTTHGLVVMQNIVNFHNFELIMHPWVYDREIKNISTPIDTFVRKNVHVMKYEDFIKDDDDELIYDFLFKSLHEEMNHGAHVDKNYKSFRTYNRSNMNLGEIHSVILAHFTGIPLLLSDDYNAKEIAAKRINAEGSSLDVKKSLDIICDISKLDKTVFRYDDIVEIIRNHKKEYQREYLKQIKAIYMNK